MHCPLEVLRSFFLSLLACLIAASSSLATTWQVTPEAGTPATSFAHALASAQPGDSIRLAPGVYAGGHYRAGLSNVTITSDDPANPAIVRGGGNGLQLSDASNVTLEHLIFEQQTSNGLNIDDGGTFETPTTGLVVRNVTVRNMNATGNNDGIKLSGVTGFLIDRVTVENWGDGGSAVDPVGSHHGVIRNSIFRHSRPANSGVRPKGGSKDIAILANQFDMPASAGRAIQAGGSTGAEFFRFIDGDSGYEADQIVAAGNLIRGSQAPFSYVNIDGGTFHHNWAENPGRWAIRILNENAGNDSIVETQNGSFHDNVVQYSTGTWSQAVNDGADTLPATFDFARNQWQNTSGSTNVQLPSPEVDGQYGSISVPRVGDQIRWDFAWGHWIVNASSTAAPGALAVPNSEGLLIATPGEVAGFSPLAADPLEGSWTFTPLGSGQVQLAAQTDQVIIRSDASAAIPAVPGDFDRSGVVDAGDYTLWKRQFGVSGDALADGNGDGRVNLADYTIWRDNFGSTQAAGVNAAITISEPTSLGMLVAGTTMAIAWRNFLR
ncbi:right-handed parallel beta-helix repeat-containing protein [Aeoliella sp. SH292]|uniref:right-handed parallel beta-helix repeat-containing protein n=1 Tax=Aeoliella sp. SH292 TaxID=3454464 RepID=UPI003F9CE366